MCLTLVASFSGTRSVPTWSDQEWPNLGGGMEATAAFASAGELRQVPLEGQCSALAKRNYAGVVSTEIHD